ncbi:MAG TPA: protein kinase [Caldimonas sp.]|jgi:hypothetical protein|nr:protein kinase [Caldimonas sp.]HEX2541348.1 protein kinase [Caldimonas sp.]
MSDLDAPWPTTTPEARLAAPPGKVSVRDSLSPGTRLHEFEIVRVLGTGGFGIVYLARDHVLLRDVAIKEYMPAALARRGEGAMVSMRATGGACAETFAKGLDSFLSEARLLASFDHPSLVKVHRFWRGNATAYMAMPYYPGQTLKDVRLAMPVPPGEAWLHAFMQPLLGALELLHAQGVFHRDISPDNILMLPDGQPVLLDFGCARRVVASNSQSFTAHLKPQFAPVEQYAEEAGLAQGAWTDLYSLGATLHFVLTGRAPTPSVVRAVRDVLPTLSSLAPASFPELPARLLATIDWTLALAPDDRPQDVQTVRRALRGEIEPPAPRLPAAAAAVGDRDVAPEPSHEDAALATEGPALAAVDRRDAAAAGEPVVVAPVGAPARDFPTPPASPRRGMRAGVAASLGLLSLAALGWGSYALQRPATVVSTPAVVTPEPAKAVPRSSAATVALPSAVALPNAEPVALRTADAAPEYSAWDMPPHVAPFASARPKSPVRSTVTAPPPAPTERGRTARTKPRGAVVPVKAVMHGRRDACSATAGLVASALCVLNPCKDPRSRTSAQCVDRQRAEQQRLRWMERR